MGWKGTLRRLEALERKRQRELEKQRKHLEKIRDLNRAEYEVGMFQNRLDILLSIHKECSNPLNWKEAASSPEPQKPNQEKHNEEIARTALSKHKPGFMAMFGDKRKKELEAALEAAIKKDEREYQEAITQWEEDHEEWSNIQRIAGAVLKNDPQAKLEAIELLDPFAEISDLGSDLEFTYIDGKHLDITFFVHSKDIVPQEEKSLLKSGKVSVKKMPIGKFNEIYQDYVCSCILRIANEVFALLPEEVVYITAKDDVLDLLQ